ncbi:MAG: glycosyltransferase family 2 protein [Bacteroidales bacterium]|nr:glycosyltransferase family 2 protein [Bacteroidales bacterium]
MEKEKIKATIIILTYNQVDTIARAIESVLRQECDYKYELLIADDASTDGTREVCEEYAARYPEKIRMMPRSANKGIVDNYFDAVLEARGELIGDCAGDDEWGSTGRLQAQIGAMRGDNSLSAVSSVVKWIDVKKEEVCYIRSSLVPKEAEHEPFRIDGRRVTEEVLNLAGRETLPFILSSALYRKDPIKDLLNSNPDIIRCRDGGVEDVPLIAALGNAGDILSLPVVGYNYYVDGESASNNLSFEKEYRFVSRVTKMMGRLGRYYGLSKSDQQRLVRSKFPYMAAQIRHSENYDLLPDLEVLSKEMGVKMPLRGKLHIWLVKLKKLLG